MGQQVTADLYVEVQMYYARQMRMLEALDVEGFAATFTEDGEIEHAHKGERAQGRETMIAGMRMNIPRQEGHVVRHWFDKLMIEPTEDGELYVTYDALVSRTDVYGMVTLAPTFTVTDILVRRDGELQARSRVIDQDTPPHLRKLQQKKAAAVQKAA